WMGVSRLDGAIGVAAGAGALLAVAAAYRAIRGAAGMGMGDVKLAGMLGAFLGWKGVLMAIFLGSLLGSLFAIALLFARRADGRTALPYGTFLAPAAAVVLLAGSRALTWYLGLFAPFTPGSR
ncbi:MAG: A24 family peptidase, partial [Candidatus Eisenbacteria bacterium]|nr:A24 family peptidase [Candidatus Eisenbacteria bacterium]